MQEYVNVNYRCVMSIVGVVEESGVEKIVAEARYVRSKRQPFADTAFIVDENYQGRGIASFLFDLLIRVAREEGVEGFLADVLAGNKAMLKVYEKAPFPVKAVLASGIYKLSIPFTPRPEVKAKEDDADTSWIDTVLCVFAKNIDNSSLSAYIRKIYALREWRNWQTHWT